MHPHFIEQQIDNTLCSEGATSLARPFRPEAGVESVQKQLWQIGTEQTSSYDIAFDGLTFQNHDPSQVSLRWCTIHIVQHMSTVPTSNTFWDCKQIVWVYVADCLACLTCNKCGAFVITVLLFAFRLLPAACADHPTTAAMVCVPTECLQWFTEVHARMWQLFMYSPFSQITIWEPAS